MVLLKLGIKPLGSILHITKSKYIVVNIQDAEHIPPIGVEVVDANNEVIGKIIDIIGPVERPYAVVKPLKPGIISLLKPSMFLFYKTPKKPARGRR